MSRHGDLFLRAVQTYQRRLAGSLDAVQAYKERGRRFTLGIVLLPVLPYVVQYEWHAVL